MKGKLKFRKIWSASFMVLMMACGPVVNTVKMTSKDLDNYETFAYLPNGNFDEIEGYKDASVGSTVISNVNKNMKELGYELDRENPDLLVLITTEVDKETMSVKTPVYATYPDYYSPDYTVGNFYEPYYYYDYTDYRELIGYDVDYDSYKEGSLILRLVDRKTKEVLWKGDAYNFISKGQNNSKAIAKYVDDIFEEYPTQTGK